jgi:NAD(P)-dependent dehydrogenase (short-subunit alcohol dehydrogenase family)
MPRVKTDLTGRVVAITGAARGIGRATAQAFLDAGARVAIGDLDAPLAEQTAAELGRGTIALALDVTDRASVDRFVAAVAERLGPIDVFVNNAGIMPTGPFLEESDAVAARQVDINLHGVLYGMKAVLPSMVARGRGHVVNVASGAGKLGFPGGVTYSATKHAVVGMTEGIRSELRGTGVEFSIVMPAVVHTELTSGMKNGRGLRSVEPEDVAAAIVDAVRTGRVDVYVPREMGVFSRISPLLPRGLRDGLLKVTRGDRALLDMDEVGRLAYRERIGELAASDAPEKVGTPR